MNLGEPLSDRTSNPGHYDRWTCCACYNELYDIGEGEHTCPHCGASIQCTLDYDPVCRTELVNSEQPHDQEN